MLFTIEEKLVASATRIGGTYILDTSASNARGDCVKQRIYRAFDEDRADLWHRRLGHKGVTHSKRTAEVVQDLTERAVIEGICKACIEAKQTRHVSRVPIRKTTYKLKKVHINIWGPAPVIFIGGSHYMCIITDDRTRKVWLLFNENRKKMFKLIKQ